jgi:carbamoyltransferase
MAAEGCTRIGCYLFIAFTIALMYILGINGGISWPESNPFEIKQDESHDAAAVLIKDGKIISAFEEERLNRIKHTNKLPVSAIIACLEKGGITADMLDAIAIPTQEQLFDMAIRQYSRKVSSFNYSSARDFMAMLFKTSIGQEIDVARFTFVQHHMAHAASAYFMSGFDNSLVISLDGSGDNFSGGVYHAVGNKLSGICQYTEDNSIGHMYLAVTRLLGFDIFDEYKVMGLAPYGNPETFRAAFDRLYELGDNGKYSINTSLVKQLDLFFKPRAKNEPLTQLYRDIAAALQEAIEKIIIHIATYFRKAIGSPNLCMAGGVALNCSMTGNLGYLNIFDRFFVQPASHDGGLPLGSALMSYYTLAPNAARRSLSHLYLGSDCPDNEVCRLILEEWSTFISFRQADDITTEAARLIAGGSIAGWFQGAAEYGPRALGNRSILGDPRPSSNKERINSCIKNRENFRPFAPSVLQEEVASIFELPNEETEYPYMGFIFKVKESFRGQLGAVTHVDNTARLQTVKQQTNPRYYQLIRSFADITGVPVLLNTSFNNNAEPIVNTPEEAIVCFLTSALDVLIIADFIIYKKSYEPEALLTLYPVLPPYVVLKEVINDERNGYILANTYDDRQYSISAAMAFILPYCDGTAMLGTLVNGHLEGMIEDQAHFLQEVTTLWFNRLIRLAPRASVGRVQNNIYNHLPAIED